MYFLGATIVPSLVTFKQRGHEISSGYSLVYRITNRPTGAKHNMPPFFKWGGSLSPFWEWNGALNVTNCIKSHFVPSLVEIGPIVLQKTILKFHQCFFWGSVIISPWKWAWLFIWINLNPLVDLDGLWQVWLKLSLCFWRKQFLNFLHVFLYNSMLERKKCPLHSEM